jgi:hypothetical protein
MGAVEQIKHRILDNEGFSRREDEEIVVGPIGQRVTLNIGFVIDCDSIDVIDVNGEAIFNMFDQQAKTMILRALADKISKREVF